MRFVPNPALTYLARFLVTDHVNAVMRFSSWGTGDDSTEQRTAAMRAIEHGAHRGLRLKAVSGGRNV